MSSWQLAMTHSSRESWNDKLEGEGGSSGQPACATAALGYKPEFLPPEIQT